MLRAAAVSYKIGKTFLLQATSIEFASGKFHVIMGANGAGKSTLLKLLSGELKPSSGTIFFADKNLGSYKNNDLAKHRAVLSQHYHIAFPMAVEEIVLMGRYPYFATHPSTTDIAICKQAMQLMDVAHLAERDYTSLSGGEAQKVQMSRVLSQIWNDKSGDKKFLFLDEPVSHLDVKYQYQLMHIAKNLCSSGTTVIAVLHDVNLALRFADAIYMMKDGEVKYELDVPSNISPLIIKEILGVDCSLLMVADGGVPVVVF